MINQKRPVKKSVSVTTDNAVREAIRNSMTTGVKDTVTYARGNAGNGLTSDLRHSYLLGSYMNLKVVLLNTT